MDRLFQPVSIASLVFFRVAFGILGFSDVLGTWLYYHLHEGAFQPGRFRFAYIGFEWVQPLPEPWMSIGFVLLLASAAGIILGWRYHLNSIVFALGFTWVFLLEKAHYLNHGYLFCWISFLMIVLPANRWYSLDVRRNPALCSEGAPLWCVRLLPFLMAVVYFYGGIAKLNADWLRAIPLESWLEQKARLPLIGSALAWRGTAFFMAYGGVAFDLAAPFLLLFRQTRRFALVIAIGFHLLNTLVFQIGIFPLLSLSLTAMFFPPDFPLKWYRRLPARFRSDCTSDSVAENNAFIPYWQFGNRHRSWIFAGLLCIVALHLLLPLRHYLFPGDVTWTEEGHRYAWRMMLRSKQGYGNFTIKDLDTDSVETVRPSKYLSQRQNRKLYAHPDMIWQFAQHLESIYRERGKNVAVYAHIQVSLNDRPYRVFIDPTVNLAAVKWQHFRASPWIAAYKKEE